MVSFNWSQPELVERVVNLEEKVAVLQRHEERTTIALAQSSVGIFDWHIGKRSIYVSPTLQELLGYEGESMPDHLDAWLEHVHIDDRSRAQQEVSETLIAGKDLFRSAYRILRCNGTLRKFIFQATIFHQGKSERVRAARVLGTAIDVTDVVGLLSFVP